MKRKYFILEILELFRYIRLKRNTITELNKICPQLHARSYSYSNRSSEQRTDSPKSIPMGDMIQKKTQRQIVRNREGILRTCKGSVTTMRKRTLEAAAKKEKGIEIESKAGKWMKRWRRRWEGKKGHDRTQSYGQEMNFLQSNRCLRSPDFVSFLMKEKEEGKKDERSIGKQRRGKLKEEQRMKKD